MTGPGETPRVGETFAHYRIDAVVERDGFSITDCFRATDTDGDLDVLLEIVKPTATSVERARFGTRARRLQGVSDHSSLIGVIEVAPTYCALEAPGGDPIGHHAGVAIARARQKLYWLSLIAGALAALHKNGVVHGRVALDEIVVLPDLSVKLSVPLSGDVSSSPLDDIKAFGVLACQLILGSDASPEGDEERIQSSLVEAGAPLDTAAVFARIRLGQPMTSEALGEKLAHFGDYSGPTTEPLLPVVPRSGP